jgi:hypothetical protein
MTPAEIIFQSIIRQRKAVSKLMHSIDVSFFHVLDNKQSERFFLKDLAEYDNETARMENKLKQGGYGHGR